MTPIPANLLKFPWYPGHLAWIAAYLKDSPRHLPPQGVSPKKAYFREADFSGEDLSEADLRDAIFLGTKFIGAKLWSVDFERASLSFSRFGGANLKWARLVDTNAINCSFEGADLTNANLQGGVFREANFNGADFSWANGTSGDFTGASLIGAMWARDLGKWGASPTEPQSCAHVWVISDKEGWGKTCKLCGTREKLRSSEGRTAEGEPFTILMGVSLTSTQT